MANVLLRLHESDPLKADRFQFQFQKLFVFSKDLSIFLSEQNWKIYKY